MPGIEKPYEVKNIRNVLKTNFDGEDLVELCQDKIPELCGCFESSMSPQKKINLIIGHFLKKDDFTPLVNAIKERKPDAFAEFEAADTEKRTQPQKAYEVASIYNFDLSVLVEDCIEELFNNQGLIGFGVPCNSSVFLSNFCERVKHELGRSRIRVKQPVMINPISTSVDKAVQTIGCRYRPALNEFDILVPVQFTDRTMGELFWRKLHNKFLNEGNCKNRLIIVMGMYEECVVSENMKMLEEPVFKKLHILQWVRNIVHKMGWQEDVIQNWSDEIINQCSHEFKLDIEWVYDYLGSALEILKEYSEQDLSYNLFKQELEQRSQ
ncbi:hypothetical protein QUF76_04020 [Desulfobacterales bacterium HSG16]|nr:hypothetical protein [Desulfobacterales bacterium HSG16]